MPIQLPDDLVIAVARIEILDARPPAGGGRALVHRVQLPVDVAIGAAEIEFLVAEQVEEACHRPIRSPCGIAGGPGKAAADVVCEVGKRVRRNEEPRHAAMEVIRQRTMSAAPVACLEPLERRPDGPRRRHQAGGQRLSAPTRRPPRRCHELRLLTRRGLRAEDDLRSIHAADAFQPARRAHVPWTSAPAGAPTSTSSR